MKHVVVAMALLALVSAQWTPTNLQQFVVIRNECFASERISAASQETINKGLFPNEPGCYYRCSGLKTGIWDDVNGYDVQRSYAQLRAIGYDVTMDTLNKCSAADRKADDPCRRTATISKCVWDNGLTRRA